MLEKENNRLQAENREIQIIVVDLETQLASASTQYADFLKTLLQRLNSVDTSADEKKKLREILEAPLSEAANRGVISWDDVHFVEDDDNGDSEITSEMLFGEDESMEEVRPTPPPLHDVFFSHAHWSCLSDRRSHSHTASLPTVRLES
jgi:hypothetical protein